jgi:hypothetical protein
MWILNYLGSFSWFEGAFIGNGSIRVDVHGELIFKFEFFILY